MVDLMLNFNSMAFFQKLNDVLAFPDALLGPELIFVTGLVKFVTAVASLPGPAWVVLITFYKHLFRAQYS